MSAHSVVKYSSAFMLSLACVLLAITEIQAQTPSSGSYGNSTGSGASSSPVNYAPFNKQAPVLQPTAPGASTASNGSAPSGQTAPSTSGAPNIAGRPPVQKHPNIFGKIPVRARL